MRIGLDVVNEGIGGRLEQVGADLAQEEDVPRASEVFLGDDLARQIGVRRDELLVHFADAVIPVAVLVELAGSDLWLELDERLGDFFGLLRRAVDRNRGGHTQIMDVTHRARLFGNLIEDPVEQGSIERLQHGDHTGQLEVDLGVLRREKLRDADPQRVELAFVRLEIDRARVPVEHRSYRAAGAAIAEGNLHHAHGFQPQIRRFGFAEDFDRPFQRRQIQFRSAFAAPKANHNSVDGFV